jgi:spermidine/putrescine transport system ATP-binding protein
MSHLDQPPDTVITLERVTKRFGSFVAVEEMNLGIGRGEFFSLLGPSGCGKTTTLRMVAGFETPTTGRIILEGQDVSAVPPYRRNVNMVFQQYALFPHMNVFDNVAFGPRSRHVPTREVKSRVEAMLEIVHLTGFGQRKPAQLSGGQQQRVALARALVNYPSALLLDEPLGALDLKLRRAMQLELKRIQRDVGITFIYVTHDQEEALTMSDRVAVMNLGRVEQLATPEEIYDRPASEFVAGFIGLANLLPATVERADSREVTLKLPGGGSTAAGADGRSFGAGESALLVLRPERLRISAAAPGEETKGRLQARVVDVVFQGPVVRFDLQTAEERDLVVIMLAQDRPAGVETDSGVWVTWDPESAYVLPVTAGSPPPEEDAGG